jgi:hypothetical protein
MIHTTCEYVPDGAAPQGEEAEIDELVPAPADATTPVVKVSATTRMSPNRCR